MRYSEEELRGWMIGGLEGRSADHAALLRALVPLLRGYYRRHMRGDDADIEDLVQDSLIAIHTRRETYDAARPFTAWLFAVARYKMIDHFRRNRRLVPIEGFEEELVSAGFGDACDARMDVEDLLGRLPRKQAAAIYATRIEGLSVTEAAAAGGMGESDVKVSVHRGLKALIAHVREGR